MSTHPDTTGGDRASDDFELNLKSLKPRTTIDAATILSRATAAQAESATVTAASSNAAPGTSPRANWWPLLTALSWLVTAIVWWSAQSSSPNLDQSSRLSNATSAAGSVAVASPLDAQVDSSLEHVGSLLVANRGEADEPPSVPASSETTVPAVSSPHWLAMLGVDVLVFQPDAAERRWEHMQAQADVVVHAGAYGSGRPEQESATYSSLREEFNSPIGADWFAR